MSTIKLTSHFLVFSFLLMGHSALLQANNEVIIDTSKVNKLLRKGRSLHYSNPDSAIYYYQKIISHYDNLTSDLSYKNSSAFEKAYLETVIKGNNCIGNIHYYNDEYKRAEFYYLQSLEIAEQIGFEKYIGKAKFDIAYISYVNNDYETAKSLFIEAYNHCFNANDQNGIFHVINACGLTDYHLGRFDSADSCYKEALKLAIMLNDSTYIADIKIHQGILYCEQQRLEEGMILFEEALDYYEKEDYQEAISDALLNIGVVMKMIGEYDLALDYILKSLSVHEIGQIKSQLVTRYYQLADIYLEMKNNDKAYEYCQKTISIAEEIASKPFLAECNFLFGKYFVSEGKYEEAISYFQKALMTAETINNRTLVSNIYLWYAKVLFQTNSYDEALRYADKAYLIARELNMKMVQKDASYIQFKCYSVLNRTKEALHWFEAYHNISDSLNYYNQQKEIKRIEAHYNYNKKEQENEILRNKSSLQEIRLKNRTITLFALALGIILSIFVIVFLITRMRYNRSLNREQQLQSLKKLEVLSTELDVKKRELTSKMMFLNQKNELIGRIIEQLKEMQDSPDIPSKEINTLVNELRNDSQQSNWKEFETQFVQVHPDFYKRLYQTHSSLTAYEQRLCAFLRMNLNTKEIASITSRSAKSIEVTRSRIRHKLQLSRKDNLSSFLASI